MSNIFLTLQKILGGALTATDGTGAPNRYFQGVPLEAGGAVAVDTNSSIVGSSQGLPITSAGRIASGTGAESYENGLGFNAAGRLVLPGLPFVPDGPTPPVTVEIGDVTYSLTELSAPWIPVGATYDTATYPDLAALFVSGAAGDTWVNWTEPSGLVVGDVLESLAYGNSTWVAVTYDEKVVTSTDGGATWTTAIPIPAAYLISVAFGAGVFVAVGTDDFLSDLAVRSTDGITWTPFSLPSSSAYDYIQSVRFANSRFLVASDNLIAYSTDGISWASGTPLHPDDFYNRIEFFNGRYYALGQDGSDSSNLFAYSTDLNSWTKLTSPVGLPYGIATLPNGTAVAYGEESGTVAIATSTDGLTWTPQTVTGLNVPIYDHVVTDDRIVAVVRSAPPATQVWVSEDGIVWEPRDSNFDVSSGGVMGAYGIAKTPDNSRIVISGRRPNASYSVGGLPATFDVPDYAVPGYSVYIYSGVE